MKISARRLSSLILEASNDVHNRFDFSDVNADIDLEDPAMIDPDDADEIDEGHDGGVEVDVDGADVSYALSELADGIAYLEQMLGSIEHSPRAVARLYELQAQVTDAIDEIEKMVALDDER